MEKKVLSWPLMALIVFLLLQPGPVLAQLQLKYQVQPGEEVGLILNRLGLKPVWTPQGSLAKTISLNPILKEKYKDFELPALTWIELPVTSLPKNSQYTVINGTLRFQNNNTANFEGAKRVWSFVNDKVRGEAGARNMRDVVIHFHGDSLKKMVNGSQPVVVNINFYDSEGNKKIKRNLSSPILKTDSGSMWPNIQSHKLSVDMRTHSLKIDGQGIGSTSQAKILSDTAYSVETEWQQDWSDSYSTVLAIQVGSYKISDSVGANVIENDNSVLLGYWVKNYYKLIENLKLNFDIGYVEKFFINNSTSNILLSPQAVFESRLGTDYAFLHWGDHHFSTKAFLGYSLGKSTGFADLDSSIGYGAGLHYHYNISQQQKLGMGVDYEYNEQGTSQFSQNNTELILSLNYKILFGESD